jgi:hypothetical protein
MIDIDTGGGWYYAKEPAWSPDGTRIVFVMCAGSNGGQVDLFTVAPDGSQLTQVTDSPEVEYVPSLGHPPAYCVAHTGLRPVARSLAAALRVTSSGDRLWTAQRCRRSVPNIRDLEGAG